MTSDLNTKAAENRAGLVAELEWHRVSYGWLAFGEMYRIEDNGPNWSEDRYWLYDRISDVAVGRFDTCEAAQAAMWPRHESRVLSVLNLALIEQQAAELAEKDRARTPQEVRELFDGMLADFAREQAKRESAESERDELLREKERLERERDAEHEEATKSLSDFLAEKKRAQTLQRRLSEVREAAKELYKWTLVIESAVHHDAPRDHPKVVAAIKQLFSALENGPAGLADAHSKSPAPSSQSERIAVLEAALRGLHDAASVFHNAALVHLSDTTFDSDGVLSEADAELSVNALPGARSALAPLGEE